MPKYLVEMHDGRKFQVDADSQPTEAEVLAHLGDTAASSSAPTAIDMLTRNTSAMSDTPPSEFLSGLKDRLQSAAHPQTAGDFASSLLYEVPPIVGAAVKSYGSAALEAIRGGAKIRQLPSQILGTLAKRAFPTAEDLAAQQPPPFHELPLAQQMEQLPTTGPTPISGRLSLPPVRNLGTETASAVPTESGAPTITAPTPIPAASPLSATDRALLIRKYPGLDPSKLEQQMASHAPPVATPSFQPRTLSAGEEQGIQQLERSNVPTVPNGGMGAGHPLDPMRQAIGAEEVGRVHGMSTQDVRDQATPILGAQPGEASPILPQQTLGRIIDTVKALPPGAEREAYVARATSGKAQWQIETVRRTLEHLGLVAPIAAGGASMMDSSVRDRLMELMRSRSSTASPSGTP